MSNFEYLGQVTIGQYLPIDSILHRLDPRAGLLFFFCLIAAITFALHPAGLLLGLAVALVCLVIAHIPLKFALRGRSRFWSFQIRSSTMSIIAYFQGDSITL